MFPWVDYDRYMSWKGGNGRIGIGVSELSFQKTAADAQDIVLPSGQNVLVMDTEFKLVKA